MKQMPVFTAIALLLLGGCSDEGETAQQNNTATAPVAQATPAKPADDPAESAGMSPPGPASAPAATNTTTAAAPEPEGVAQKQPAAGGEVHTVKAVVVRFVPPVIFIQPGDTVHWTNMNGHNTHAIDGLIPQGAEPWRSKLGEDYSRTFTVPGAYIYKCDPHYSLGMVAAIVVGPVPPANLEALEKSPANRGMAKRAIRILKEALAARKQ